MVQWGIIVGDKLPIGPATPIVIYIFPTCGISEVHRIFTQWCDTRDMRDEYYVGLDCLEDVFKGCSQVRQSRKKGLEMKWFWGVCGVLQNRPGVM